jgi:hypothetical protein
VANDVDAPDGLTLKIGVADVSDSNLGALFLRRIRQRGVVFDNDYVETRLHE